MLLAQNLQALQVTTIYKPIMFELLPERFTLTMLQQLHEQIFGTKLDKRNFRKQMLNTGYIRETKKIMRGGQHRPAKLYVFDFKKYNKRNV
jgi:8-oxo-dGTP diphosphatase